MGTLIKNLGVIREFGKRVFYYFKCDVEGFLLLYKCTLDGKKTKQGKMIMNTGIKHDPNILSWYYVKTGINGELSMWKTVRTFNPPDVRWGKAKKTLEKESRLKKHVSWNPKMTDGVLDITMEMETTDGLIKRKIEEAT